jgi:carboxylesterase
VRRSRFLTLAAGAATLQACDRPGGPAPAESEAAALTFPAALEAIQALIARDKADPLIAEFALPRLYHHGKSTDDAVVLFHGFTNCPQQFVELAERFHARGCNVYVPRIPLHGYRDRLTRALANLTVAQLESATTDAYRLTRGLGRRVSAVGLSLGGTMALYLAQTQPIDLAVPVSPFLMPIHVPDGIGLTAMRTLAHRPDRYVWWDPRVKEKCPPPYAYPGFPTHGLAQIVFFGNEVVKASKLLRAPQGRACTLVTNRNESAVNNAITFDVMRAWKARGARYGQVVLSDLGAPRHDIIDPTTFPQAATLVYPKLEAIVLG